MRSVSLVLAVAVAALLAAVPVAQAKPKPITGKLSKPGYTVIAVAANGKARAVRAKGRSFRVVPPANKVTLQLRTADGVHGGPVVVGSKGKKKVIVGVKAGAKLGKVRLLKGYAKPRRKLDRKHIDASQSASARKGVPIGAGVFGRVEAKTSGPPGSGRDQDRDGLPGAFDVDDDGDLILDNFERASASRKGGARISVASPPAVPGPPGPGAPGASNRFRVFSNLKLDLEQSLNANASAVTDAQIDQAMSSAQTLAIEVAGGKQVELDCGGLTYCSNGGSGKAISGGPNAGVPFPGSFDSDNDGFGLLTAGSTGDFQLLTGAKASEIGSGDAFIEIVSGGGTETQLPGVLNYAFSTTPALSAWSEGASSGVVSYPIAAGTAGTQASPITVSPAGDVIVTLEFWRPQRKAIPGSGEGSGWVDIGRLKYTADLPNAPVSVGPGAAPGRGPGNCPGSAYSSSDPNLSVASDGVVDSAMDRAADPANSLTFSVNLTACLASGGLSWTSGQSLQVDIQARSEFGDNAAQKISFRRG